MSIISIKRIASAGKLSSFTDIFISDKTGKKEILWGSINADILMSISTFLEKEKNKALKDKIKELPITTFGESEEFLVRESVLNLFEEDDLDDDTKKNYCIL